MTDPTKTPHKHAAVIKAWADGAATEFKGPRGNWIAHTDIAPAWFPTVEYRVKPQHKHQDLIDAFRNGATDIQIKEGQFGHWATMDPGEHWVFGEGAMLRRAHKWQKEMDAFDAGKEIQFKWEDDTGWSDTPSPAWRTEPSLDGVGITYRIKPERVEFDVCITWLNYPTTHVTGIQLGENFAHLRNVRLTFEGGTIVDAKVIK